MGTVIKVEQLSKQYRLGLVGSGTFREDSIRWWAKLRGKDDPFLQVGSVNDRTIQDTAKFVWSLKDINFDVQQGDVLGIIGRNGAGKSTLLKILSKVTAPTTGSVKVKGRIASLLEVGTGFHPELTGRENIFLNGAILGMRNNEIKRKFDEIIAFAGVEKYIDTPVKRYSSGMYVRLAFAVAAHLESEILIVDEVLAVGDSEFQQKCLGKMGDISRNDGRTILFVSHNILAINSLCKTGLMLNNGQVEMYNSILDVSNHFRSSNIDNILSSHINLDFESNLLTLNSIKIFDNGLVGNFDIDKDLIFEIQFYNKSNLFLNVNLFFQTIYGELIFVSCSESRNISDGEKLMQCVIPKDTLNDNIYKIGLMFVDNSRILYENMNLMNIEGVEKLRSGAWLEKFPGLVRPNYFNWAYI